MTRTKVTALLVGLSAVLVSTGCSGQDSNNPTAPRPTRVLTSADEVALLVDSTLNQWYLASTHREPWLMLMVTADNLTSNFSCCGARFNNLQPRIAFENSGPDESVIHRPWQDFYWVKRAARDVLLVLDDGLGMPGGADRFRHLAMMTQAFSFSQLALLFDRAFIVDESTDLAGPLPPLSPYSDVASASLEKLDALIAATAGASHTYDQAAFPMTVGPLTSSRIHRLANTMAALTLRYTPRQPNDPNWPLGATEWNQILGYTGKGIGEGDGSQGAAFDVEVSGDQDRWYSLMAYYGSDQTWKRVDMRLISLMDPSQPPEFQEDHLVYPNHTIQPMNSPDARGHCTHQEDGVWICGDFQLHPTVLGDPQRGIYMLSPVSYARYSHHGITSPTPGNTPVPWMLAAESDLLHAEAIIQTGGSLAQAAGLINKTRVGRGGLSAATAAHSAQDLLDMIWYERQIELTVTNGWDLYRHRIYGSLRPGTVCQLPIPATELQTMGAPNYTFGGPAGGAGSAGCNGIGPAATVAGRPSVLHMDRPNWRVSGRPIAR